ncbi:477_t:CDS:2 [Racocetra persica]|uniref:477_t:CDS:1 n=1 Tax=Racocetra persica TaxID=160502 RepID=A0ACA9LJR4_9GLOM|nr:477_t:CDS:2 [Racocetra persica]
MDAQNEREFFDKVMKIYCVIPLLFLSGLLFITAPYGKFQWNKLRLSGKFGDNYLYDEDGRDIYKSPRFFLGVFIFLVGMTINIHHDNILFSLRSNLDKFTKSKSITNTSSPSSKYVIPNGGLFNYIVCANYFGEIVEWTGFVIAAWYSFPAIMFLMTTLANLIPRARSNLKWYREKFGDAYPKNRKAIIPFVL